MNETTPVGTDRATAPPEGRRRAFSPSANGLRRAAAGASRAALFVGSFAALILARAQAPLWVVGCVLAVSLGGLYALGRTDVRVRLWSAYIAAFVVFVEVRSVADETGIPVQYGYVRDGDLALFGGYLPTEWLQDTFRAGGALSALDVTTFAVYASFYFLPHLVAFVLAQRDLALFRRYIVAVLGTVYAGLLVCVFVPTAPPWLAGQEGAIAPVIRVVPQVTGSASSGAYERGEQLVGLNAVAAFPSLHTALAVLVGLVAMTSGRRSLALAGALYPLAMALSLVYLGEHYAIDALAGAALAVAVWAATRRVGAAHRINDRDASPSLVHIRWKRLESDPKL